MIIIQSHPLLGFCFLFQFTRVVWRNKMMRKNSSSILIFHSFQVQHSRPFKGIKWPPTGFLPWSSSSEAGNTSSSFFVSFIDEHDAIMISWVHEDECEARKERVHLLLSFKSKRKVNFQVLLLYPSSSPSFLVLSCTSVDPLPGFIHLLLKHKSHFFALVSH